MLKDLKIKYYYAEESSKTRLINAIKLWNRWKEGEKLRGEHIKTLYGYLETGTGVERGYKTGRKAPEDLEEYTLQDCMKSYGLLVNGEWHEVFRKNVKESDLIYFKGLEDEGKDYDTPDGTCIRDYIHVVDLAEAHVSGLKRMMADEQIDNFEVFNLGTGKGKSVLEVIKIFEKVSGVTLNYKIVDRRPGDIVEAYADTAKANKILRWKAKNDLGEALKTAWEWEKKLRNI